jgi:intein/homing endonuclease
MRKTAASGGPPREAEIRKKKRATGTVKANPIALPARNKVVLPPLKENCLACRRFNKCSDPDKAFDYICGRFRAQSTILSLDDFMHEPDPLNDKPLKKKKKKDRNAKRDFAHIKRQVLWEADPDRDKGSREFSDETSQFYDVEKIVASLNNTPNGVPIDLRVDDRDVPEARNFMEFCVDKRFLNFQPFPKQLEVGLNLYGDYCWNPKCTDVKFACDIPTDASYDQILDKITLFNRGKCPRCDETRADAWKRGQKKYNELAGLAGQRCITGDSLVLTGSGIQRFDAIAPDAEQGFSDYNGPAVVLENGAVAEPSKFFKQSKQLVRRVRLSNGWSVVGTPEHPLLTKDGFIKTKDLVIGTVIPLHVGQNVWGNRSIRPEREWRPLWRQRVAHWIESVPTNTRPRIIAVKPSFDKPEAALYRLLGWWVAEGSGGAVHISNQDQLVLDDCADTLGKLYGENVVARTPNSVRVDAKLAALHFNIMLDDGLHCRSAKKFIPSHVLQAPKHFVVQFLRALFEGDGGFNGNTIEYSTISRRLQRELSAVLANLGIVHRLSQGWTWATNGTKNQVSKRSYHVWIEGPAMLRRFRDEIGFISKRKQNRLDQTVARFGERSIDMPFWYDKYPQSVKTEYLALLDRLGQSLSIYRTWHKERAYFISRFTYGLYSIFDENDHFWRLQADNVALSKQRLRGCRAKIEASLYWRMVDTETRQALLAFYDKYDQSDLYWVEVANNKALRRKRTVYDFHIPVHHRFIANGIVNHNSGKSRLVTMIASYNIHRYLKLQNPIRVLNLAPNEVLFGIFTATTFKQARETLFDPLYEIIDNSPWFKEYHALLDEQGRKLGEELYNFKDIFFNYNHRRIVVYPAGPDKKNLRGRTSFLGGVDELGWLFSKSEQAMKLDPDEIYNALSNSFLTVRSAVRELYEAGYYDIPPPIFTNISSPSSSRDKMMRLVKEAEDSQTTYSFHYSVYQMNPRIKPEDLEQQRRNDPVAYKRDFLALPPDSTSAFIHDRKSILACVDKRHRNLVITSQQELVTPNGAKLTGGKVKVRRSRFDNEMPNRLMAIDAGHTRNSFAACIMHLEEQGDEQIPMVDALIEIIPKPDAPVSFTAVYKDILLKLIEDFNVCFVGTDRWNSVKMMQDIENEAEIPYSIYSIKYADMLELREAIVAQNIILPRSEMKLSDAFKLAGRDYPYSMEGYPVAHMMVQALTVEDRMGKMVDKGRGYTDDLFRAFALSYSLIIDEEVQDLMNSTKEGPRRHRELGVVVSYGNGAQGGNVSSSIGAVGSFGSGGSGMSGGGNTFSRSGSR